MVVEGNTFHEGVSMIKVFQSSEGYLSNIEFNDNEFSILDNSNNLLMNIAFESSLEVAGMVFYDNDFYSFTVAQVTYEATFSGLVFTENLFSSAKSDDLYLFFVSSFEGILTIEDSFFEKNTIEAFTNAVYLFELGTAGDLYLFNSVFDDMKINDNLFEVAYVHSSFYEGYIESTNITVQNTEFNCGDESIFIHKAPIFSQMYSINFISNTLTASKLGQIDMIFYSGIGGLDPDTINSINIIDNEVTTSHVRFIATDRLMYFVISNANVHNNTLQDES